jgi:DNA polymerase III epsilon subunit family exonuclease
MTALLGKTSGLSWSTYRVEKPITTRTGKLPGQRAEPALSSEKFSAWLTELSSRGVSLAWETNAFVLYWPSQESYSFRDVERVRVNWASLLEHFHLRPPTAEQRVLPLSMPLSELPLVFLDTETTGSSVEDRIIELYAAHSDGAFFSRFDPDGFPVQQGAYNIHGITDEELVGEPLFSARAEELLEFVEGQIIVAHNAQFDCRMLRQEFSRLSITWEPFFSLCTLKLARRLVPESPKHTLEALAAFFGITQREKHRASADVETLRNIWPHLIKQLPQNATLQDLLQEAA